MKRNTFFVASFFLALFVSCSNELDTSLLESSKVENTVDSSIDDSSKLIEMEITPEMKRLKEVMKATLTRANYGYNGPTYDENFEENMYAIRELPLTIEVREAGSDKAKKYFSCDGNSKEVVLTNYLSTRNSNHLFYIKRFSPTSGMKYMIYSQKSKTPLAVGHYNSRPDEKILIATRDGNDHDAMMDWDIIPCTQEGYFSIQNRDYLEQANPNDSWSVFYYSLEVNNNNKIGFARYTRKAQQEFMICPIDKFTIDSVVYDKASAKIEEGTPVVVSSVGDNPDEESDVISFKVNRQVYDQSRFVQNRSNIKFLLNDKKNLNIPDVKAMRLVLPERPTEGKAAYSLNDYQNIPKSLNYQFDVNAPANTHIEATTSFRTFNVTTKYTIYATSASGRTIRLTGTWKGIVFADPSMIKPSTVARFYDLDSGEEVF